RIGRPAARAIAHAGTGSCFPSSAWGGRRACPRNARVWQAGWGLAAITHDVIPATAGTQTRLSDVRALSLESRRRGNDVWTISFVRSPVDAHFLSPNPI